MTLPELFARPEAAPILFCVPIAWLLLRIVDRRRSRSLERSGGPRLPAVAPRLDPRAAATRRALLCGGLLLTLLALLEPLAGEVGATDEARGIDLVLALDVSQSMLAKDVGDAAGTDDTRLAAAKRELDALARHVRGDRLGLVVFAGSARRVVPLTSDLESLRALAADAGPESEVRGGSDLGAALELALEGLRRARGGVDGRARDRARGSGAIVLLTDGEDLALHGFEAAERCAANGVVVHAVGFGSRGGSKLALARPGGEEFLRDRAGADVLSALDAAGLERITARTGGSLTEYRIDDRADGHARLHPLVQLYDERILPSARQIFATGERRHRASRFQWPLLAGWVLWMLAVSWSDATRR